jgi:hypothetical protein
MKLVAVFAASLISVAAFAQSATVETETVTSGLLGKRYVSTGFAWTDINNSSVEGMSAGLNLNVPVHTNFDLNLGYGYSWLEGAVGLGHSANAALTGYITRGAFKPFASVSTGYQWTEKRFDSDHGIWGAEVGVECELSSKLACDVSVGYDDDFRNHGEGLWDASVGATYNFTDKLVGMAKVSYVEYGSVGYMAGLAVRF